MGPEKEKGERVVGNEERTATPDDVAERWRILIEIAEHCRITRCGECDYYQRCNELPTAPNIILVGI